MPTTRVVILAAGKGTRMKSDVPKPLIKVLGESMIERLVKSVKESGVDERPVVVVGSWSEQMFRDVLRDEVAYVVQDEQLGTGHALRCAESVTDGADRIIVLYGDHPFVPAEVIRRLAAMQDGGSDSRVISVAMLTARVPNFEGKFSGFLRWGRIIRDEEGRVVKSVEAKDATPEQMMITEVNPCMYAFPAPWVWEMLQELKNENAQGEYYLTDLVGAAMAGGVPIVTADADPMDVVGINSPEELAKAEEMMKK